MGDDFLPQRLFEFTQSLQPIHTLIELPGFGTDFSGRRTLADPRLSPSEKLTLKHVAEGELLEREMDWLAEIAP